MQVASSKSALLLGLVLPLAACGGDDASAAGGLEGGDIDLAWTTEEAYTLGGYQAIDWDAFGDVSGIGFDDEGNLHILDTQAARVHVVAPSGERVRSFGTQGEGPGELNRPESMVVFPDGSLAVYDFGKFGWVRYDAQGEWVEDVTFDNSGSMQLLGNFSVAGQDAVLAEVVGEIQMRQGPGGGEDVEAGGEAEEPGQPIVRVALDEGAEPTTVFRGWEPPEPEGPESEMSAESDAGNVMQIRMSPLRAFEPDVRLAGLPDGGFAVVDSTSYDVEIRDAAGELVATVSRPISPVQVTESIREAERNRRMAEIEAREERGDQTGGVRILGGGGPGGEFDMSGMNRMMRERIENMTFYPEIPVIEALAADRDGRIWIQRTSGEPGEDGPTDIVLADRTYVGTLPAEGIRIPDAFGPGGLAAWIETDEYDAQRIVVKRIVEGGSD